MLCDNHFVMQLLLFIEFNDFGNSEDSPMTASPTQFALDDNHERFDNKLSDQTQVAAFPGHCYC